MQKKNINLVGNLIYDEIYLIDKHQLISSYENLGGIGNMISILEPNKITAFIGNDKYGKKVSRKLEQKIQERVDFSLISQLDIPVDNFQTLWTIETEHALVMHDKDGNKKSYVNWQNYPIFSIFKNDFDWTHISYLDKVNVHIVDGKGILSADLCSTNLRESELKKLYTKLKLVDFLIISEKEKDLFSITDYGKYTPGLQNLSQLFPNLKIIVHSKDGSIFLNKEIYVSNKNIIETPKRIVGAGDIFAATFIKNYSEDSDIKELLKLCHETCNTFITGEKND